MPKVVDRYWLNDVPAFDFEVVLNGKVHHLIPKELDDDDEVVASNRRKAEGIVKRMNTVRDKKGQDMIEIDYSKGPHRPVPQPYEIKDGPHPDSDRHRILDELVQLGQEMGTTVPKMSHRTV